MTSTATFALALASLTCVACKTSDPDAVSAATATVGPGTVRLGDEAGSGPGVAPASRTGTPAPFIAPSAETLDGLLDPGGTAQWAILKERTAVSTSPDGARIGQLPDQEWPDGPLRVRVVSHTDSRLRIVYRYQDSDITLLLHVARKGILPMLTRDVRLSSEPSEPLRDTGFDVTPGGPISIVARKAGWLRLAIDDRSFPTSGWVPEDAVGDLYELGQDDIVSDGTVDPGTAVFRERGKREFAKIPQRVRGGTSVNVLTVEKAGTATRVQFTLHCSHVRVTGWVSADVTPEEKSWGGHTCNEWPSNGDTLQAPVGLPTVKVDVGQVLLDKARGNVIGVVRGCTELSSDGRNLFVPSPWGPVPVVAAPSHVRLPGGFRERLAPTSDGLCVVVAGP